MFQEIWIEPSRVAQKIDIDQYYEDAQDKPTRRAHQPRPQLTVEDLTGSNGLMQVAAEFRQHLPVLGQHSNNPTAAATTSSLSSSITAAARYSLQLVQCYTQWAHDLCPTQHAADNLRLLEQKLGPQKKVQAYVEEQRNQWCRDRYLDRVLGKETTERILQDYQDHRSSQQEPQQELFDGEAMVPTVSSTGNHNHTSTEPDNMMYQPDGAAAEGVVGSTLLPQNTERLQSQRRRVINDDDDDDDDAPEDDDDEVLWDDREKGNQEKGDDVNIVDVGNRNSSSSNNDDNGAMTNDVIDNNKYDGNFYFRHGWRRQAQDNNKKKVTIIIHYY